MPFNNNFDDIYKLGIKATCEELGTYCERVDEQIFQGSILDRILNQISKADIIIADMTGKNANVFFEVGYAKALDKKIILLTSSVDDIPFDLQHYTHVIYDKSIINLKEILRKYLKFYLANPDKSSLEMTSGVNLYINGVQLVSGNTTKIEIPKNYHYAPITIENVSGKTLEANSFQLVAKSDENWIFDRYEGKKYITDKSGKENHMIYNTQPIFHGAEYSFSLCPPPHNTGDSIILEVSFYSSNFSSTYKIELVAGENAS